MILLARFYRRRAPPQIPPLTLIQHINPKKRTVDERMKYVAAKSLRVTFLFIVGAAFLVIVYDGISPITMPYPLFMNYSVCAIILAHYVAYPLLLRSH
jgi:uncharacterized membrane protein